MRTTFILFFLSLFFAASARADLLVEPLAGYSFGYKLTPDKNGSEKSGSGASFGGRVGFQKKGLQVGFDYLKSSIKMNDSALKENLSVTEMGAFAGYSLPEKLRFYVGLLVSASANGKKDAGYGAGAQKYELSSGGGFKGGFTYKMRLVDLNFEFRNGTFGKESLDGVETNRKMSFKSYLVSLSIPLLF